MRTDPAPCESRIRSDPPLPEGPGLDPEVKLGWLEVIVTGMPEV